MTIRCRHPSKAREHINSCVERCGQCGMLNAMIAGRTSICRRWVAPEDLRVQAGTTATLSMLELFRAKYSVGGGT